MSPVAAPAPRSYRQLLQNRNFALLWAGQSVSVVGDIIFSFTINWLILTKTNSALQVGGNLIVSTLTSLAFSALAGVLADRWPRQRLLIGSDLLRGGVVLALVVALWVLPFNIFYVYATNFLLVAIASFFVPAYQATLPNVLKPEELVLGRSLSTSTTRLLQALGSVLSGLLLVAFAPEVGMLLNALSFFFSALMVCFVRVPSVAAPTPPKRLTPAEIGRDIVAGWQVIRSQAALGGLFIIYTLGDFGAGFTWPVHVAFANQVLHGGPELYGYLSTAALLGGFIGAFLVGRYHHWFNRKPGLSYVIAATLWGTLSILFGLTSVVALALVYRFFIGLALSMIQVPLTALVDTNTADTYRGRVWATLGMGSNLSGTLAVVLSGLAADHWTPRVSYVIAGVLLMGAALVAWRLPQVRQAEITRPAAPQLAEA